MIALLLSLALLSQAQEPQSPPAAPQGVAQDAPAAASTPTPTPERSTDPVERPPASATPAAPEKARPRARPEGPRAVQSPCLSRAYADANPDACTGRTGDTPRADEAPAQPTSPSIEAEPIGPEKADVPAPAPPVAAPAAGPGDAPVKKAAAVLSLPLMIALGCGILLLLLALTALVLKLRGHRTDAANVRPVELSGPDHQHLSPAALARSARGPGKSRWSIRDGRLILTGPAGTLLNGVPLDRAGDIVSTGDTVRLDGVEYRVRII